jgi:DNA-binding transcriptional LysR family regulator
MDLQHLRCFLAVAEELHFGRAAERLHLTPSPVSRSVKELERDLGAKLFERRYHAVELTAAGAALVEPVREILRSVSQLRRIANSVPATNERVRTLRIGVSHVAPPAILHEVMEEIQRRDETIHFDVEADISLELLDSLERDEIDLAIVHLPIDDSAGLEHVVVADYSLVVAMRADDELAGAESLTLSDLAGRTMVTQPLRLQPASWVQGREALEAAGITSFHEISMTDPAMFASYVRHTRELHLTTAHSSGAYADPAFTLVPVVDERAYWGAAVVWRRDIAQSVESVKAASEAIHERFADARLNF